MNLRILLKKTLNAATVALAVLALASGGLGAGDPVATPAPTPPAITVPAADNSGTIGVVAGGSALIFSIGSLFLPIVKGYWEDRRSARDHERTKLMIQLRTRDLQDWVQSARTKHSDLPDPPRIPDEWGKEDSGHAS
jgi:hypothetical protein